MKMKHLLLALLCLLANNGGAEEATTIPTRNYTMVNFTNVLNCILLEVGTTSITFSVEWSPDIGMPRTLDFIGKLYPETRGWSCLYELEFDQAQSVFANYGWTSRFPKKIDLAQRKAIFEISYSVILWAHMKQTKEHFSQRAFFSVNFPVPEEDWNSIYWKEYKEEEEKPPVATAEAGVQEGEKTSSAQGKFAKQDGVVVEQEKSENKSNPNRLWLYAGILLLICAVFYFLRRKLKTGN